MYISIQNLMLFMACFVVFCLIVAVSIYLIITLNGLHKLLGRANRILESNEQDIHRALALLPDTIKNVDEVAINVKESLQKAEDTVGAIENAVAETVATVSENTENLFSFINVASGIVKILLETFSKFGSKN